MVVQATGNRLCCTAVPCQMIGIFRERLRQHSDSHVAVELSVPGADMLAHMPPLPRDGGYDNG